MSPPIGACKTSSPVNSTEVFDAPTSAIVGPNGRVSKYISDSSTISHDESYISSRAERITRIKTSAKVNSKPLRNNEKSHSEFTDLASKSKGKIDIGDSDEDIKLARKRHQDIKRRHAEQEKSQEWNASLINSFGIILTILVLIVGTIVAVTRNNDAFSASRSSSTKEIIRNLKQSFPSQTADTWKVIASNIRRISNDKSTQAACIVFVGRAKEREATEKCIASIIAQEVSSLQSKSMPSMAPITISNATIDAKDFKNDRSGLHSAVEESLSKNSAVVLFDIDYLDGRSAMALHSFCDSDPTGGEDPSMAPYVHKAVFTTVKAKDTGNMSESADKIDVRHVQSNKLAYIAVERDLSTVWKSDIGEDKAASLISRVALNAVMLNPETSDIVNKMCP